MSDYKTMYKDKLSKMLFLEVDPDGFKKSISMPDYVEFKNTDLYIPISSDYITQNATNELRLSNLPIYYFIEGMFTAFGADPNIRYIEDYGTILTYIPDSEECVKSIIADKIKKDNLEDAYILLKGFYRYTEEEEIMIKLLNIGEVLRERDTGFTELFIEDISLCKEKFFKCPEPHLYNALILRDDGEFKCAQAEIHEYINKGGKMNPEVESIVKDIENISTYEKAVELVKDNPEKAMELLIPLSNEFSDNPLIYYYLGVCCRKLQHYNKAIHYLNRSISIESGILEVVNELGMNYACLNEFEEAIKYFKKAFEASNEVEICTNIVMCYYNLGDMEQARLNLDIAKKIAPDDEIVIDIDNMINRTK